MARTHFQQGSIKQKLRYGAMWYIGRYHEWVVVRGEKRRRHKEVALGLCSEITLKQAQRKLKEEFLDEVNRRTHPINQTSFGAFAEKWMVDVLPLYEKATREAYTSGLKCHLIPAFGGYQLRDISGEVIQQFIASKAGTLRGKSIRNHLDTLKSVLNTAASRNLVDRYYDPFRGLKLPKIDKREQRFFTAEESTRLVEAATGKVKVMLMILRETGLRYGEISALSTESIVLDDPQPGLARLYVKQSQTGGVIKQRGKSLNAMRKMILTPSTTTALRHYMVGKSGLLFTTRTGRPLDYQTFRRELIRLAIKARVPVPQSKAFRHGQATQAGRSQVNAKVITDRLGHSDILNVTLKNYMHQTQDDEMLFVNELEQLYQQNGRVM